MSFKSKTLLSLTLALCVLALALAGCGGEDAKYRVDYNGEKGWYEDARDEYAAGETVRIYFPFVATDTNYYFYLDGERLYPEYVDGKGFEIVFTMPARDVFLMKEEVNTMENTAEPVELVIPDEEGVMLVDHYFAVVATVGGDEHREFVLYSKSNTEATLKFFEQRPGEEKEREEAYTVPVEAVERCYRAINERRLRAWNEGDGISLTGAVTVVKFKDGDSYTRVSTEHMPVGVSEDDLQAVENIMWEYYNAAKENKVS